MRRYLLSASPHSEWLVLLSSLTNLPDKKGRIEGAFGKGGKFKVYFPDGVSQAESKDQEPDNSNKDPKSDASAAADPKNVPKKKPAQRGR